GVLPGRRRRESGSVPHASASVAAKTARNGRAEFFRRATHDHAADYPRVPALLRPAGAHPRPAGFHALPADSPLEHRPLARLSLRPLGALGVAAAPLQATR